MSARATAASGGARVSGPHLLVRVGAVRAALPAGSIERVVRGLKAWPLAGVEAGVSGLAEFAGEPLAVLDLRALLGLAAAADAGAALTVVARLGSRESGERIGLAVEEAIEVAVLPDSPLAEPPGPATRGELLFRGEPLRVVDLAAIAAGEGAA